MNILLLTLVFASPPAPEPLEPVRTYGAEITIEPGEVFDLEVELDVPEGHRTRRRKWHFPPEWTPKQGRKIDAYRYVGTASPGKYIVRYTAESANPIEYTIPGSDPPRTVQLVEWGSEVMHEVTWVITVLGPRPPPEEEKPEVKPPADGVRNAVILYDEESAPPAEGEAAAAELRKGGTPVIFTAVGSDPPAFLVPAITAAREVGYPALVVQDGLTVNRAVKLPESAKAICEEVKR